MHCADFARFWGFHSWGTAKMDHFPCNADIHLPAVQRFCTMLQQVLRQTPVAMQMGEMRYMNVELGRHPEDSQWP